MRANGGYDQRSLGRHVAGFLPAAAMALLGVGLVLYLTRDGAGAGGDSAWYLMGAENLLSGNGYVRYSGGGELRDITGFPPAYSVALALASATGIQLLEGAVLLNTVLFGANLLLAGLMIYRAARSTWATLVGVLLLLTSATLIESHSWVMSEALYILLALLVAHLVASGIPAGSRFTLGVAGALASAAIMTRYVGFSLIAAGMFCILLLGPKVLRWRLSSAGLFVAIGLVPALGWLFAQASDSSSIANRQVLFHVMNPELLAAYQRELVAWVFARQLSVPWRYRAIMAALVASIGPIYFLITRLRQTRLGRPQADSYREVLPWFLGSYVVAFFGVLIANSLFLDAATTLGAVARYLVPAYVALVILSTITTTELVRRVRATRLPAAFALSLGLLLVALHALQSVDLLGEPGLRLGYAAVGRNSPELVVALRNVDPEQSLISNNPEMVFILTDRPAYLLPIRVDAYTQREREDYPQNIDSNRKRMESGAILVIFGNPDGGALEAMNDLNVTPLRGFSSAMFYKAAEG